jgi:hypothetical protein
MSLGYLPTPCGIDVFFTLPHGDSLQTPFHLFFPPFSTLRDRYNIGVTYRDNVSNQLRIFGRATIATC